MHTKSANYGRHHVIANYAQNISLNEKVFSIVH